MNPSNCEVENIISTGKYVALCGVHVALSELTLPHVFILLIHLLLLLVVLLLLLLLLLPLLSARYSWS